MQRRNAKRAANATSTSNDVASDAVGAVKETAAQATSSSAAAPAAAASAADTEAELRGSSRFILLRSALLLVIFFTLHTLTQWYLLEPWFQPHRTAEYKRQQEINARAHIAKHVCPSGQECNFELKPEYKL